MFDFIPLPDYSALTAGMVLLYVVAGIFGALVRVAWLDKPLRGFYRDENGGLHMGFFAEVITAVAVALVVDGHPVRAGIAAIFAPFILEAIRTFVVDRGPALLDVLVRRKIGNSTTAPPDKEQGK